MRPLKLTMQAYGAYLERVEIPFSKLGESNIFLICGNTGSGKTTIYDAVCFALFNTSSGSYRGNATLRSHFAPDNIKSFVEFEFMFKGEKYRILRTPQYQRKKLKGEGLIKENATAELYLPDGRIIYNVCDVDKYIVELLGLNHAQFSQIALLAQGEFLKLLNSSTNERNEIFRTIFNTDIFLNFQNNLKDEYSKYKLEISNLNLSILQYISQIRTDDEKIRDLIEFIKENEAFLSLEELIEGLKKINNENNEKLLNLQNEAQKLNQNKENLANIYQNTIKKSTLIKNKLENGEKIKQQKEIFSKIEKEFYTIEEKNKEKDSLKVRINELEKIIEKIKKIELLEKDLFQNNKRIEISKEEIDKLKEKILNYKIQFLNFKNNELESLNKEKEFKQNEFEKLNYEFREIKKLYDEKYDLYLSHQAGILAKTLKENTPCPVCGSIFHPQTAKCADDVISRDELDNLKNEIELKNGYLAEVSKNCSIIIEKINAKQKDILTYKQDNQDIINSNIVLNSDNFDDFMGFENGVDFEKEIKNLNSNQEINFENIQKLTLENTSLKTQIDTLKEENFKDDELSFENLTKEHLTLKAKLNTLTIETEAILKNYKLENDKLISLTAKDELFEKQLDEMKDVDVLKLEEIEEELEKIKSKTDENNLEIKNLNLIKGVNDDVYSNLTLKNKELKVNYRYFESYNELYKIATGNLKGARKVTFEQYIQAYYLDLVLIEANKILKVLTRNQFQFLRNKENLSSQIKTSLDIEIMDFYTYKTRSSKTLSGGESFLASLSLALGLSNVASNLSGVKNIDMLFIDEGFGTLDNESLEKAINVIVELSSNKRLIGIISHIEELKNNIQNQIKTTKTPTGAKVEIQFLC